MKEEIKKFISYFFVGGMAALVEWGTFALFDMFTSYMIATIVAFVIATLANYILGKIMTFKNYKKSKKDIISVFIVSGIGLLMNMGLMYLFVNIIKIPYRIISKIIATGIVFFWNYISRRIFIYKEEVR